MKKRSRKFLLFGSIAVILVVAVSLSIFNNEDEATIVQADLVLNDDIFEVVTASGRVQPQSKVDVTSEVSAQIIGLEVQEGDFVIKGQPLVQLDTVQLNADVAQARYQLDEIIARTEAARSSFVKNEKDFKRQQKLYGQKLISETIFTDATYLFESSKANHEAMQAQMKTGQARLDKVTDNLSKTKITAPMDGVITYLNCEKGEIAQAQTAYTQGRKLMTVSDLSVFEVEVEVDETEIAHVRNGQIAKIKVDAFRDTLFEGTVIEIGNSASIIGEGTENFSTNFRVKVRFNDSNVEIRPGMSASVDITTNESLNATLIPYAAVVTRKFDKDSLEAREKVEAEQNSGEVHAAEIKDDDTVQNDIVEDKPNKFKKSKKIKKTGVFVIRGGKAEFIEVKTGIADERNIEILEGLIPGDSVISGSYKTLRALSIGDEVTPDETYAENKLDN